jgi:DNA-binding NarL/FixJ family response regulator
MYRTVVADDHPLFLMGVVRALEESSDFHVVGTATSGADLLPLVGRTKPNVVLLDLRMPGLDGLACIERIVATTPGTKVVVVSAFDDSEHVTASFTRGAAGYIVKSIDPNDLAGAVRQICEGNVYRAVHPAAPAPAVTYGLTSQERAVLASVARGLGNAAIARELWVSEPTVKFHLTKIYRKLSVANRTEAARFALEHGLVEFAANDR